MSPSKNGAGFYEETRNTQQINHLGLSLPHFYWNCRLRLPGRTELSMKSRANKIGFYFHAKTMEWSLEVDEIMIKYYPIEGLNVSKRLKNRSKDGVKYRATKLFLRKKK